MSKSITTEILPQKLPEHPAVKAWSQLQPERIEPENIEILKLKRKSAVYRLSGLAPDGSAVIAKRCVAETGRIELTIHKEFLARLPAPALACYGFVEEPNEEFCWLFLEEAIGQEYSPHNAEHRALAGRWLGTMHHAAVNSGLESRLPGRQPGHYHKLLQTSRGTIRQHLDNPALPSSDLKILEAVASHCDVLESHWSELEQMCEGLPRTLVHGDFVSKNVRIASTPGGPALVTFDWEFASWGLPATDLCQFTGGAVSPDLSAYCALLNGALGRLDLPSVERLSECGKFFRLLDDISWATLWLVFDSYLFLEKPMSYLKIYESRLAGALRLAGWKERPANA